MEIKSRFEIGEIAIDSFLGYLHCVMILDIESYTPNDGFIYKVIEDDCFNDIVSDKLTLQEHITQCKINKTSNYIRCAKEKNLYKNTFEFIDKYKTQLELIDERMIKFQKKKEKHYFAFCGVEDYEEENEVKK